MGVCLIGNADIRLRGSDSDRQRQRETLNVLKEADRQLTSLLSFSLSVPPIPNYDNPINLLHYKVFELKPLNLELISSYDKCRSVFVHRWYGERCLMSECVCTSLVRGEVFNVGVCLYIVGTGRGV